jgi:hypothetical protein
MVPVMDRIPRDTDIRRDTDLSPEALAKLREDVRKSAERTDRAIRNLKAFRIRPKRTRPTGEDRDPPTQAIQRSLAHAAWPLVP